MSSDQRSKPVEDLRPLLESWPYEDDEGLQVRRIIAADGRPILQLRVDLGLLQMECEGRPDGRRPYGYESLLEYHRARAEEHRRQHGWYEGIELSPADCAALRLECIQYYHRRVAYRELQEYGAAVADADHNLEILDLLKAFAREREDWLQTEAYRPFILAHRYECQALRWMQQGDARAALLEIERGLRAVREAFAEQDRVDGIADSLEITILEEARRKLASRQQVSFRHRLQILLDDALRREDPDAAADLRAQLRYLERDE